jgi:hypothetical protein
MMTDALLLALVGDTTHPLAIALAAWLSDRRFAAFAEQNRDKIRKKIRTRGDPEALADLRGELATAMLLLRNRQTLLEYERYAAEKLRGPDFSASWGSRRLDIEVSRIRGESADLAPRAAGTICAKLGQLRPGLANLVVLVCDTPAPHEALGAAARQLLERAARRDATFFARHGYTDMRVFHRDYLRMSAAALVSVAPDGAVQALGIWANPQSRHRMPDDAAALLRPID